MKVYGVLRTDDMQRIKPADVEWMESGLVAKLKRTKTTGPGKKIGVLRVFIPKGTCVVDPTWMQKGYELWYSSVVDKNRDFFLARATTDCQGFSEKYASAGDLAGMRGC